MNPKAYACILAFICLALGFLTGCNSSTPRVAPSLGANKTITTGGEIRHPSLPATKSEEER